MKSKHFWTLFAIAAVLRVFRIGSSGFWYDESFTILVSRLPLGQLLTTLSGDVHPPLYYWIMWGWIRMFGEMDMIRVSMVEWYIRLPSVVFSLAGLYVFWKICEGWEWPAGAQYLAVGFMALTPFQVHYAQEARMYALFQLETLIAVRMIQKREWGGLGLVNLATLYTHNYALFTLPGLFLVAWLEGRKVYGPKMLAWVYERAVQMDLAKKLLPPFVLPCLFFLPWFLVLRFQMAEIEDHYWIQFVRLGEVVDMLVKLIYGFSQPDELQSLMIMTGVGVFVYVVVRFFQSRPGHWLSIIALVFTPFTLALIVSYLWQPVLLFRGLIVSVPFFYLLAGWVFSRLDRRKLLYAAVLIVPLLIANSIDYYLYTFERKGDLKRDIQAALDEWYQPGMSLVHVNDGSFVGWQVYAPDVPQYRFPDCDLKPLGSLTPRTVEGLGWEFHTLEDVSPALIIWAEGPMSPACEAENILPYIAQSEEIIIYREDDIFFAGLWYYETPYVITR